MENIDIIEEWRTAIYDGILYEGLYKVSNLGRILSLNYKNTGKAELMTPVERKDGYSVVGLWKNRKSKTCLVHRLVAQTFLPNPDNLPEINHIDENKENNRVENLEWCTSEYNNNYGTRNERAAKANTNGKCSKKVLQFTLDGIFIREWPSTNECGRNGFNQTKVSACCRGERKTHKGYIWKYKIDETNLLD